MDAPLDDLTRAYRPGIQTRAEDGKPPTLFGHFTPFGQWSEIHSYFEGDFMERTVKGAFAKTIKENRAGIRVLYDHGHDPQLGNKPLGPIAELREEDFGPFYEVPLIDTDYNRDFVIPALDAGLLGASYRFRIIREEWNDDPGGSDHNPKGLPERTIKEARLYEFGPVTFPAFEGATAKLRSLSDHYHDLDTPSRRAAHRAPDTDGVVSTTPDADLGHLGGMTPGQRSAALRAFSL